MRSRAFRPGLDRLEGRRLMSMGGGGGSSTLAPVSLAPLSVGIPTFTGLQGDQLTFQVPSIGLGTKGQAMLDVVVSVYDANNGALLQTLSAQALVSGAGATTTNGVIPLNSLGGGNYNFVISAYDGSFQVPDVVSSQPKLIQIAPRVTGAGTIVVALNPTPSDPGA